MMDKVLSKEEMVVLKTTTVSTEKQHREKRKKYIETFKDLRKKSHTKNSPYTPKQTQQIMFLLRKLIQEERKKEINASVRYLNERWKYEKEHGLNKTKTVKQIDEEMSGGRSYG